MNSILSQSANYFNKKKKQPMNFVTNNSRKHKHLRGN